MKTRESRKRAVQENGSDSEAIPASKKGRSSKAKSLNIKEEVSNSNSIVKSSVSTNSKKKEKLSVLKKSKFAKKKSHIYTLSDSDDDLNNKDSYFPITKEKSTNSDKKHFSETKQQKKSDKKKKSKNLNTNDHTLAINETKSAYFAIPETGIDNDHNTVRSDVERLSASDESDQDNLRPKVSDTMSSNKSRKSLRNSKKHITYKEIDEDDEKEVTEKLKVKCVVRSKQKSKKKNVVQINKGMTSKYFNETNDGDFRSVNIPDNVESKATDDVEEMSGSSESEEEEWLEIPGNAASHSKNATEQELLLMLESESKKPSTSSLSNSNKPQSIEITLLDPEMTKQCKTKSLEEVVKQKVRKVQRETQEYLHKSHLLCVIAHGIYLNKICSSDLNRGLALSSMTDDFIRRIRPVTLEKVKLLLNWFKSQYSHYDEESTEPISTMMKQAFLNKRGTKNIIMLLMVVFMRTLSIEARIVIACNPLSLKLNQSILSKPKPTSKSPATKKALGTDSDDDFDLCKTEPDNSKLRTKNVLKKNYKMLSDNEEIPQHLNLFYWIEFFLPKEKRWICLEYFSSILDDYNKIASNVKTTLQHLTYVFAFNPKQSVKDISAKYDPERYTITRKLRVSSDWLDNALKLYAVNDDIQYRLEEEEIRRMLMALPFPSKVDDFNNHPLYALTRFLKKYEVMYPPNPKSVGFIKNEPIYLRDNVRLCHTRETWLKSARVIRLGEQPVKKVRAQMSMKRKLLNEKDPVVELFGYWQTEPYDPPVAKGGIVPKNEHGNVDLYQECMLPIGCVYLQLPGLQRVAKKLNIDVAPAMIGWQFHARFARPILEGWVVCQEHAETLQDAWANDADAKDKQRDEERSKRALKHWRQFTRFLLIRDRVRSSYDMQCPIKESAISSVALGMAQMLAGSSKASSSVLPQDK